MEFFFWMMDIRLSILLDQKEFGTSGMFVILKQEEGCLMKRLKNTWD
ncbi:hypothetical protein [Cytobacillus oceanisediminis]|nr:hypothetical protein [Cytobacillus oceanisediminis]